LPLLAALAIPVPAAAQDIVVTASRRDDGPLQVTGVGIRRRADFAVQTITVYGDAREKDARRKEILDTVRNAIELAGKRDIQVAYGASVIQPLTLTNYADKLKFEKDDDREDAESVAFVIKTPLKDADNAAAIDRLNAFIKAAPKVGRAVIERDGEPGVSIVDPTQYRQQIVAAIAADANAAARDFGPDYVVEVGDLARPVRWALVSATEVLLYIDHDLKIVPKR
jgi:hypothetical protein